MKKYIFTLIAVMNFIMAQGQTNTSTAPVENKSDSIQTLFSNVGRLGWWVSPDFGWSQIDNKDVFMFGISGGIIVKHSFSFGLAGYGIMNSQNLKYSGIADSMDLYLYGGYGGFKMEYRISPMKMINVAFPLLIGGGGISYSTWSPFDHQQYNQNEIQSYAWDSYFVLEPGVVIGVNMLKFMRLDIGASYRYAPGIELPRTSSDIMNSFSFITSLKFGRF